MMHALTQISKQWTARALSLCVVGPACSVIASGVIAPDGSRHATFLSGSSVGSGIAALVMVLGLTSVMGVAIGRVVDRREGLLNMSFVLGWVAWTGGRLGEVYRIAPESGTMLKLAAESVVIAVCLLIAMMLMSNPDKGSVNGHQDEVTRFDFAYVKAAISKRESLFAVVGAIVGAITISYLFGQTDLPGQSVGVGFGAGIIGGTVGALAANMARDLKDKDEPTPFAPIIIGVMLCGVIGPMIGMFKPGAGVMVDLVTHGEVPGYLIVSPMAWAMGAMLGVPVGHSWVEHSVHHTSGAHAKTA